MPTWAQIFFALVPTTLLLFAGILWLVRRLAHLEGKVDAILSLLGLFVKLSKHHGEGEAKGAEFLNTGR
jgi:hypothetical protein